MNAIKVMDTMPGDECMLVCVEATSQLLAISIPADSASAVNALSMAIIKCVDLERRVQLAYQMLTVCQHQARRDVDVTC